MDTFIYRIIGKIIDISHLCDKKSICWCQQKDTSKRGRQAAPAGSGQRGRQAAPAGLRFPLMLLARRYRADLAAPPRRARKRAQRGFRGSLLPAGSACRPRLLPAACVPRGT